MNAVDIGPIPPAERHQSALDLFLIFACANIVATTFQTGASLVPAFSLQSALGLVAVGSLTGSLLIAALASLGPRLRTCTSKRAAAPASSCSCSCWPCSCP